MRSEAATVHAYLDELEDVRRVAIAAVRDFVLEHLPPGFEEGMQYGMIGYYVPLERFPDTYDGQPLPVAALASQKRYMALDVVGEAIARTSVDDLIAAHEQAHAGRRR